MNTQCYLCYLQRNVELARSLGDEETATAFAKDLMALYLSAPEGVSAPWFGPAVNDLLKKYYQIDDDRFRKEKEESNRFVLERMSQIRCLAQAAPDPVYAALQYAILGNYIDFAALRGEVSFDALEDMLRKARELPLDETVYQQFLADLEAGKNLLYLTDNAGEIGFDRILAEELKNRFPHLNVIFCVRGGPAQNDATREDAAAVGIPFPVIDNGTAIAGTQLDLLGEEAHRAITTADVILSKGQGNAETLLGCGYNIYYAFLIKCPRFVQMFGKEKLTPMLIRERT